jgi:hypothetical protein
MLYRFQLRVWIRHAITEPDTVLGRSLPHSFRTALCALLRACCGLCPSAVGLLVCASLCLAQQQAFPPCHVPAGNIAMPPCAVSASVQVWEGVKEATPGTAEHKATHPHPGFTSSAATTEELHHSQARNANI